MTARADQLQNVVAIVNPSASDGRAERRWPELETQMRRHWPQLGVRKTQAREHATTLARRALEDGAQMVVSVGGDGTNNEVLGGFVDAEGVNRFPDAVLGIVASGTGGDFQRMWGPLDPSSQVERLAKASIQDIDYGVARFVGHQGEDLVRPFLNIASVGISGQVDRYVNQSSKFFGSTATYVLASLRGIVAHENQPVNLRFDAGESRKLGLSLLVIGNGQYFGAGMWACPKAEVDDGHFDTILLPDFTKGEIVSVLGRVFKGKHLDYPGLEVGRTKSLVLEPAIPGAEVLIDLDGEQPGRLPASFDNIQHGLRLAIA